MTEFIADGTDRTTTLKAPELTCDHRVTHVTEELEALDGVKDVSVLLNKGRQSTVTVFPDTHLDNVALAEVINEAGGYTLDAVGHDNHERWAQTCPIGVQSPGAGGRQQMPADSIG